MTSGAWPILIEAYAISAVSWALQMGQFYDHYLAEETRFTPEYVARYRGFYEMEQVIKRETLMAGKQRLSVEHPAILKFDVWEEASKQGEHNVLPALIEEIYRPRSLTYVDIERALIGAAMVNHGTDHKRYVRATIEHLPFRDSAFDAVIDFSTTDHLFEDARFAAALAGIHRVLQPGGLYLLYHDNEDYFRSEPPSATGDAYHKPRSLRLVSRVLEDCGFAIETHRYIYPFLYDKGIRWHRVIEGGWLRAALPGVLKYRFFNLRRLNAFFFVLARCKK
jgi:SAM-dependent methyltransferase